MTESVKKRHELNQKLDDLRERGVLEFESPDFKVRFNPPLPPAAAAAAAAPKPWEAARNRVMEFEDETPATEGEAEPTEDAEVPSVMAELWRANFARRDAA